MRNVTNVYQNTLETYYNLVQAYSDMMNEHQKGYMPFLDYCFDIAQNEFEDGQEYHVAIEYKSPEAQAIIAAAERFEEFVNEYYEDDEEWNALFVIAKGKGSK